MIYGVIMAGGKGERFWPLSNESRPKQLLSITSERNMLQVTMDRISSLIPLEQMLIVTGENICDAILETCDNVKRDQLLAEPFGRNTCLAVGFAAVHLQKKNPKAVMVVLSADHLIKPATKLVKVIKAGTTIAAEEKKLITIGIVPTRAETGYGYIELGDQQWEVEGVSVCNVAAFKEKPGPLVAQQYYFERKHLWNSGMFIWSVAAFMEALEKYQPEMYELLQEYSKHIDAKDEKKALEKLYREAEPISVDIAIMEQADNVLTLKADFIWDDVGSWMSLQRFKEVDKESNIIIGPVITHETFESTIYNDGNGIIAALGVSDLVIVKAGDVVMVAHKTKLDKIKEVLERIAENEEMKKFL